MESGNLRNYKELQEKTQIYFIRSKWYFQGIFKKAFYFGLGSLDLFTRDFILEFC